MATCPGGPPASLPRWAQWFLEVGSSLVASREQRIWVAVTVPDRRFAAGFAALGAVLGRIRASEVPPPAERMGRLSRGEGVTWKDSNGMLQSATFERLHEGMVEYRTRVHGGGTIAKRPVDMCETFWPLADNEEPFPGPKQLSSNEPFVNGFYGATADVLWRPALDAIVCGTQSTLFREFDESALSIGGTTGSLGDVLRPRGFIPAWQRPRSAMVTSASRPEETDGLQTDGLAIFDGPQAYLRMRDSIAAAANLVIVDRWSPRAQDAVASIRLSRNQTWIDTALPALPHLPSGVELLMWAAEA